MTTLRRIANRYLALVLASAGAALADGPIRPLAQDHVVVAESPDPDNIPMYTPSLLRLPSGRLVAAYEWGGTARSTGEPWAHLLVSDDHGLTWRETATTRLQHARLFQAGGVLYYLGHVGDLQVARSLDDGETWSEPVALTSGQKWHQSACNVWHARGYVYLVMERRAANGVQTSWKVGDFAPVLMRAPEEADLTQRASWTFASELPFSTLLPGYKENAPATDSFGVPFFPQSYPKATLLAPGRNFHPMGWLETNVVQIMEPEHYWFDPTGHTFHLFMRVNTGGTGYAAMAKVIENGDGTMTTSLECAPSGQRMLFLPFPGGQMRFHVLYDETTRLYWLLGSQPTDSMRRVETLSEERSGLPNNERHRMVLHFSRNMVDWCFAGLVAIGDSPKQSRHYASMDFDGNDLVILSRSGDDRAQDAHDVNLITFHRVKNFRQLVY